MTQTATKERPILFSPAMVTVILQGWKTQTRRILKPQPPESEPGCCWHPTVGIQNFTMIDKNGEEYPGPDVYGASDEDWGIKCPYGQPGDRLYVKEALRGDGEPGGRRKGIVRYARDGSMVLFDDSDHVWPWKRPILPARFMPKWAARIWLQIDKVSVERLQDISEEDARAEGVSLPSHTVTMYDGIYRDHFAMLWNSIHGDGAWDQNQWVWVIEFTRIEP